jgi:hypothetical protein
VGSIRSIWYSPSSYRFEITCKMFETLQNWFRQFNEDTDFTHESYAYEAHSRFWYLPINCGWHMISTMRGSSLEVWRLRYDGKNLRVWCNKEGYNWFPHIHISMKLLPTYYHLYMGSSSRSAWYHPRLNVYAISTISLSSEIQFGCLVYIHKNASIF